MALDGLLVICLVLDRFFVTCLALEGLFELLLFANFLAPDGLLASFVFVLLEPALLLRRLVTIFFSEHRKNVECRCSDLFHAEQSSAYVT